MKVNLSPLYRQLMKHADGWSSRPDTRPPYRTSGEHSTVSMRQSPRARVATPAAEMPHPLRLAPNNNPPKLLRSQF